MVGLAGCLQTDPLVVRYEEGLEAFRRGRDTEDEAEGLTTPYDNPLAAERFDEAALAYGEAATSFERAEELAETAKLSEYTEEAKLRALGEREEMLAAARGDGSGAQNAESAAQQHSVATLATVKQATQTDGFLF